MSNGNPLIWVVIGIVIIGCIIGAIILYNWSQEGQEYAKSGDIEGLSNWLIGAVIVLIIILGGVAIFSRGRG